MKKFNQMTEAQMSKASGGSLLAIIAAAFIAVTGVGTGAGLAAATNK